MKLNRFNIKIIIYAVLISFTGFMAFRSLSEKHLVLTYVTWILLWLTLLISLIRMLNRTNRRLDIFLQSLPYPDQLSLEEDGDLIFRDLNLSFNRILGNIQNSNKDREAQNLYFRNTVEHISTGLISFDRNGKIKLINKAARQIFNLDSLPDISALDNVKSGFSRELARLKPGESKVFQVLIQKELKKLSIRKAKLKILDEDLNILSIEDIRTQLEEEELEAWQKLISILRHEIMNSAAPIRSLSNSLLKLTEKIKDETNPDQYEMIREGLEAISNRSNGMMDFVEAYRSLTSIPDPVFTEFPIASLLNEVKILFTPGLKEKNIRLTSNVNEDLLITADYNLLSQVIINLVKNSIQAVSVNSGLIRMEVQANPRGYISIFIIDNGHGISTEEMEKIFIPFYSTREKGSGIGLSLARQIMRLHKGNIRAESSTGNTSFEIRI